MIDDVAAGVYSLALVQIVALVVVALDLTLP